MARIGSRDRIKRQGADGGGLFPVIGVRGTQGGNIQGGSPLTKGIKFYEQRHNRVAPKIKRDS
jgi:hypothetical protein